VDHCTKATVGDWIRAARIASVDGLDDEHAVDPVEELGLGRGLDGQNAKLFAAA